jgi:hypothetical protein
MTATPAARPLKSRFPLMTDRENQRDVLPWLIAVERNRAALTRRDHELPQSLLAGPADQRMPRQNLNAIANHVHRGDRRTRRPLGEDVRPPLEIGKRSPRIDYLRHARAFGRAALPPRTRAAM